MELYVRYKPMIMLFISSTVLGYRIGNSFSEYMCRLYSSKHLESNCKSKNDTFDYEQEEVESLSYNAEIACTNNFLGTNCTHNETDDLNPTEFLVKDENHINGSEIDNCEKGLKKVFILDLPNEILHHVSQFLSYKDIISLSKTCISFKNSVPKIQQLNGPDRKRAEGNLVAIDKLVFPTVFRKYLDTRRVCLSQIEKIHITISLRIKGFKQHFICIQLIRKSLELTNPEIVVEESNLFDLTPRKYRNKGTESWTKRTVTLTRSNSQIVKFVENGDYFRFVRNISDNGTCKHANLLSRNLKVKNFHIILQGI